MHNTFFTEISLLVALGAFVALCMRALRQPLIIGHIITGVLVGPAFLNLVSADTAFEGLSSMGVALLLFIIGLDLNLTALSRLGKTVLVTGSAQVLGVTAIGYTVSQLLGFGRMESAVTGVALALSSTLIIVKLFNDKRETTRLFAQITIGVLLLQDIIATAAKIGLSSRAHGGDSFLTHAVLIGRGVGLIALLYILSRYLLPRLTRAMVSSRESLLLFALGWGLGFATLFEHVGFSIEIGALFAGVSLASLPYSREMASRLKPLRDFFLVIFFITLGQTLTPGTIASNLGPALALSVVALLAKPLITLAGMGIQGYTKRASFKAAIAMSQVSEFSLVFVASALGYGLISGRVASTITLVALITFAASTYLIKYDDQLFRLLERHLRFFERKVVRRTQAGQNRHYPIVLFGYRKGGPDFIKTFRQMNRRFVVVDYDPEVIDVLEHHDLQYLYGDASDPELLDEMNIDKSKLVVSTISDQKTNLLLADWLNTHNPSAVFVCSADTAEHASELYSSGASYVMLPHYIGSEKINSFIRRNGFSKTEFKHYRDKHIAYLQTHFEPAAQEA